MNAPHILKKLIHNKIAVYITSRYAIYGIQFLNTLIIGLVLDIYYFAIWSFINMVLGYLAQANFGVPHSLNVLLSINKGDEKQTRTLLSTSLALYLLLALFILLIVLSMKWTGIVPGVKYDFGRYLFIVALIGIFTHFNSVLTNYFRVYNRINEILFCQSVVQVCTLFAIIFIRGELLFPVLLGILLMGQFLSLCLYLFHVRKEIVKPDFAIAQTLLRKGFFLFLYNGSFYLIMLTTRTIVSDTYTEEEFATFSFALILANTIMLLFDSFNFLIYPKTIHRFSRAKDNHEIVRILNLIRVNYLTSVHLVMYGFIILYPFLIRFIPKYSSSTQVFTLIAMTVVFYSNCFVFSGLLTALGKEKLLSVLSVSALVINITLGLLFATGCGYEYVILCTLIAYVIYNIMLWRSSFKQLQIPVSMGKMWKDNFPLRLFLPFGMCFIVAITGLPAWCYPGVLSIFIGLNWKQLIGIKEMVMRIINDSSIINI